MGQVGDASMCGESNDRDADTNGTAKIAWERGRNNRKKQEVEASSTRTKPPA